MGKPSRLSPPVEHAACRRVPNGQTGAALGVAARPSSSSSARAGNGRACHCPPASQCRRRRRGRGPQARGARASGSLPRPEEARGVDAPPFCVTGRRPGALLRLRGPVDWLGAPSAPAVVPCLPIYLLSITLSTLYTCEL